MKLLLVEDEEFLARSIAKGLKKRGYAVDCAFDGEEALSLYEINRYNLMILDLNLPKVDGLEVLRRIREKDAVLRILILSARSTVLDKINGLDMGSNDYLTKPFDFEELEARIRALLRQEVVMKNTKVSIGSLHMDTVSRRVFWKDVPVELTKKEFSVLEYLMLHSEKTVAAEELIEYVWDSESDPFSNSIRYHMSSLRKKLAAVSGNDSLILTMRGQGYRMAEGEDRI